MVDLVGISVRPRSAGPLPRGQGGQTVQKQRLVRIDGDDFAGSV
jgi:hypothetical protein